MGESAETGVVNEFGEVWNYPNLYVADGVDHPDRAGDQPLGHDLRAFRADRRPYRLVLQHLVFAVHLRRLSKCGLELYSWNQRWLDGCRKRNLPPRNR